ncbi:MAG: hypothetical protein PHY14_02425 [Candidatus Gracilibacteria bacterium]|nr:hypothetical protein [Candidatus Gracilibacteria bacterium]
MKSISTHAEVIGNGPYPGCLEKLASNPTVPDFKNFYHDWIDSGTFSGSLKSAEEWLCTFYVMGGSPMFGDIQITQVIPVYFPLKNHPQIYQFVYTGQEYATRNVFKTGAGLFWGVSAYSNFYEMRGARWFVGGALGGINPDAYLTSQKEPFASAPMLQMYYYLGQPLLVARSSTGIVTDVFFQGRTIANPMERAKKYLGKKWYSP